MAGGVPAGRLSIEIVAEIARLQQDLDKAKRMVGAASKDMERSTGAVNDNFVRTGKSGQVAGHHMRNLAFQFQDLGIQMAGAAASGDKFAKLALMAILQQGGQIQQIMSDAGIGVGGLGKAFLQMTAKFGPVLLAIAAIGGALKIVQDDLNETGKASLSFMDVMLGTMDAIAAYTTDKLGPAFTFLGEMIGYTWKAIVDITKFAANSIISLMIAVPNTIYAAFTTLPQAVAELFVNMANGAIKAIEDLVNKAVKGPRPITRS